MGFAYDIADKVAVDSSQLKTLSQVAPQYKVEDETNTKWQSRDLALQFSEITLEKDKSIHETCCYAEGGR